MCRGHGLESFLGKGRRNDGSSPHKQGEQAWGWGLSPSLKPSVDLATSLKCPLGGSTKDLNLGLSPGDDVAGEGLAAAGGQVVDLPGVSLRSQMLKWASSPTNAWVASNPPPRVSFGEEWGMREKKALAG